MGMLLSLHMTLLQTFQLSFQGLYGVLRIFFKLSIYKIISGSDIDTMYGTKAVRKRPYTFSSASVISKVRVQRVVFTEDQNQAEAGASSSSSLVPASTGGSFVCIAARQLLRIQTITATVYILARYL